MKKSYSLDDKGRPIESPLNVSQMNVFEYLYYFGSPVGIDFQECLKALCLITCIPIVILFYPVFMIFGAKRRIKEEKEFCKYFNKGLKK